MDGIGKEFIEKTKYKHLCASDQYKGIRQPPLELEYDRAKQLIALPKPEEVRIKGIELLNVCLRIIMMR